MKLNLTILVLLLSYITSFAQDTTTYDLTPYLKPAKDFANNNVKKLRIVVNEDTSFCYQRTSYIADTLILTDYNEDFNIISVSKFLYSTVGSKMLDYYLIDSVEGKVTAENIHCDISHYKTKKKQVNSNSFDYTIKGGHKIHTRMTHYFDKFDDVIVGGKPSRNLLFKGDMTYSYIDENGDKYYNIELTSFQVHAPKIGLTFYKITGKDYDYTLSLVLIICVEEFEKAYNARKTNID